MNRSRMAIGVLLIMVMAIAIAPYVSFPRPVYGQPQISISPSVVNVLQNGFWQGQVVVSGAGFTPGGDVLVSCGEVGPPNTHVMANSEGRVYWACQENLQPGTYTIFMQDMGSREVSNPEYLNVSALTLAYSTTTSETTVTYPQTTTTYLTTITNNVTVQNVIFTTVYSNSTFTIYDITNVGTTIWETVTYTNPAFTTTTVFTVNTITEQNQTWTTITYPTTQTVTEYTQSLTTITDTVVNPVTVTTVTSPNYTVTIGRALSSGTSSVMFRTNPPLGIVAVPAVAWFTDGQGATFEPTLSYPIIAISPYGAYTFSHWGVQGNISVQCYTCQITSMRANGSGVLTAYFLNQNP